MFANKRTGATVHTYVAPPDGLFVTSHLAETEHELTVIDAQFRPEHAAEVKAIPSVSVSLVWSFDLGPDC